MNMIRRVRRARGMRDVRPAGQGTVRALGLSREDALSIGIVGFLLVASTTAFATEDSASACKRVASVPFPDGDRPTAKEKASLSGCDAEALYYGIGVAADPVAARKCAFLQMETESDDAFGGKSLLMTIYANGKGARKDLDLAMRLACEIESAPAELDGRIADLEERKAGSKSGDFDICDNITSGMMQGSCASHDERVASVARERRLSDAVARLPAAEWKRLDAAAKAFFDSRSDAEVEQSGSARGAFVVDERADLEEWLTEALEALARGRQPPAKSDSLQAADAELNRVYSAIQKNDGFDYGTVTRTGIRATQRLWTRYRDAFVALAAKTRPDVPADAWRAWLTTERMRMLTDFAGG